MDLERLRVGELRLCGSVGSGRVALSLVPVPISPPRPQVLRRLQLCACPPPPRNLSAPERFCSLRFPPGPAPGARGSEGKMAAPISEDSPALEPGAAPYGNFPNYSRFHPPEGRVSLLPGGLLQSLFPAAARPLLGLDVGCNSGVRGRLGGHRGRGRG